MSERTQYLLDLKAAATKACHLAVNLAVNDLNNTAAVNWAALRCSQAIHCEDETGRKWYEVLIEEADPASIALQYFIRERLAGYGFPDVEVRTEW